jgi:predicted RNA-binding protein YlqC (UPF0109 family)
MATKRSHDGAEKTKGEVYFEQRLLIDSPQAGAIIGKGGAVIKGIREDTSAFISILSTDDKAAKERVVTVKGSVPAVGEAMGAVARIFAGDLNEEKCDLLLLVHKGMAGAIIGKAGAAVQEVMATSGANVSITKDVLPHSDEKTCKISGTPEQIQAAVVLVCQRMQDNPLREGRVGTPYVPGYAPPHGGVYGQSLPPGYGSAPFNPYGAPVPVQPQGPLTTESIVISTASVGAVIGKGGSAVREIKDQSGASQIGIANPDPATPTERLCTITGTAQAVQAAIYLIRQRVESQSAMPAAPAPGPPFGALSFGGQTQFGFGSPTSLPPAPQLVEKIAIPTECSGSVIGKGGSVISEMKAQSGCTISIANADTANPDERVVTITGSSLGVQNAIILIRQRVESYQAPNKAV